MRWSLGVLVAALALPVIGQGQTLQDGAGGPVDVPGDQPGVDQPGVDQPNDQPVGQGAEAKVRSWFRGFEFVPTAEHFRGLGAEARPVLLKLALAPSEDLVVRARAVSSLAYLPAHETSRVALSGIVVDLKVPSMVRRKGILVLAEHHGVQVMDLVASVFESAVGDAPLREACARALRVMGEPAWSIREALLANESVSSVKALLREDKQIR